MNIICNLCVEICVFPRLLWPSREGCPSLPIAATSPRPPARPGSAAPRSTKNCADMESIRTRIGNEGRGLSPPGAVPRCHPFSSVSVHRMRRDNADERPGVIGKQLRGDHKGRPSLPRGAGRACAGRVPARTLLSSLSWGLPSYGPKASQG